MAEQLEVMRWLGAGVPVSLLIDLWDSAGPKSAEIYRAEPTDLDWIVDIRAA